MVTTHEIVLSVCEHARGLKSPADGDESMTKFGGLSPERALRDLDSHGAQEER